MSLLPGVPIMSTVVTATEFNSGPELFAASVDQPGLRQQLDVLQGKPIMGVQGTQSGITPPMLP